MSYVINELQNMNGVFLYAGACRYRNVRKSYCVFVLLNGDKNFDMLC